MRDTRTTSPAWSSFFWIATEVWVSEKVSWCKWSSRHGMCSTSPRVWHCCTCQTTYGNSTLLLFCRKEIRCNFWYVFIRYIMGWQRWRVWVGRSSVRVVFASSWASNSIGILDAFLLLQNGGRRTSIDCSLLISSRLEQYSNFIPSLPSPSCLHIFGNILFSPSTIVPGSDDTNSHHVVHCHNHRPAFSHLGVCIFIWHATPRFWWVVHPEAQSPLPGGIWSDGHIHGFFIIHWSATAAAISVMWWWLPLSSIQQNTAYH